MPNIYDDRTEKLKIHWGLKFQPLVGRTIAGVRYMTPEESAACGWSRAALVIILDDGTMMWPSADDEGNDAGALNIQPSKQLKALGDGAPVI